MDQIFLKLNLPNATEDTQKKKHFHHHADRDIRIATTASIVIANADTTTAADTTNAHDTTIKGMMTETATDTANVTDMMIVKDTAKEKDTTIATGMLHVQGMTIAIEDCQEANTMSLAVITKTDLQFKAAATI